MNRAYVVCESEAAAAVLTELFRPHFPASALPKVEGAGDRSYALGVARTRVAVAPATAVALVLDGGVMDPMRAAGHRQDAQDLLRQASGGRPCETFQFMPQLDVIFFADPKRLARALAMKSIPETTLVAARYVPTEQLTELLRQAGQTYDAKSLRRLTRELGPERLAQHETFQQLLAFLTGVASRKVRQSVA